MIFNYVLVHQCFKIIHHIGLGIDVGGHRFNIALSIAIHKKSVQQGKYGVVLMVQMGAQKFIDHLQNGLGSFLDPRTQFEERDFTCIKNPDLIDVQIAQ